MGGAWARGNSVVQTAGGKVSGLKLTLVVGDELQLALALDAAGKDQPQSLSGRGHTRIEQKMPDGTVHTSTGDELEASFWLAPRSEPGRGLEIASAEQTGHVEIRSVPGSRGLSRVWAWRSGRNWMERTMWPHSAHLTSRLVGYRAGRPRLNRGDTSVTADTVRMMQQTGDVWRGRCARSGECGVKVGGFASRHAATHGGGRRACAAAGWAELKKKGETLKRAPGQRRRQGASQVEAANLLLDRGEGFDAGVAGGGDGSGAVGVRLLC